MTRRTGRLTWAGATVACAVLATVVTWRGEVRTWRVDLCCPGGAPLDPYYLALFSWTPLASLAWFGAGAVLLARRVRYRGPWYMAPQVLIIVMMLIRLAALGVEGGFPNASALGPGTMTPVRWALLVLGGLSFLASLAAAAGCMRAAVLHRAPPEATT